MFQSVSVLARGGVCVCAFVAGGWLCLCVCVCVCVCRMGSFMKR